jgi:hypothetical protein
MRKAIIVIAAISILTVMTATARAFDIKPGLWEMKMTSESTGAPPIAEDMLAKLTPERRAAFEAAMKARMNHPIQHVYKHCITREELDKPFRFERHSAGENCSDKVLSKTATSEEISVQCTGKFTSSSTYRWQALTPESTEGTSEMTMTEGAKTMKSKGHMTGKWIGADCGNVR